MANISAIISMLHEPVLPNSATRMFRQAPVLAWTLERLKMASNLNSIAIICWEDQLEQVAPIGADAEAYVLAKGPRMALPSIETVAASRRWADGWRGGLLSTCDFDRGFYAPAIKEVIDKLSSDAVMLVDPSAGLVDPKLIDQIITHASSRENVELFFTQAAPGLGGALLRPALVERLASAKTHPGRLLNYLPESPMRDPISGEGCVPVPAPIARTTRNFRLDSDRQIRKIFEAAIQLNGELAKSDSEDLIQRLDWGSGADSLPRELVMEINTARATSPIFWAGKYAKIDRGEMSVELAGRIFEQFAAADDARITFAGIGDPLRHPKLFEILAMAKQADISAIHVETDFLPTDPAAIEQLAMSDVDVVSVHLPAMATETYAAIMGVDRFAEVIQNIQKFVVARMKRGTGLPLLVPIFTKCQLNLGEMDTWYDQWLKAVGSVVVREPSACGGVVPDCGVADMSPPLRRPCARLASRMTVLSTGLVPSCEQDVLAKQPLGDLLAYTLTEVWGDGFANLRQQHATGQISTRPLCGGCREWHRP